MDIKDLINVWATYAKGYGLQFFSAVTDLSHLLEQRVAPGVSHGISLSLFLVFSTLIGASIRSLIPNRPPIAPRAVIAIAVMALFRE